MNNLLFKLFLCYNLEKFILILILNKNMTQTLREYEDIYSLINSLVKHAMFPCVWAPFGVPLLPQVPVIDSIGSVTQNENF